ncbi:MAG: TonB family protein [Candidatus Accumulibacter sp.]|nr:TonB family protein [Accumulibacter sp.]
MHTPKKIHATLTTTKVADTKVVISDLLPHLPALPSPVPANAPKPEAFPSGEESTIDGRDTATPQPEIGVIVTPPRYYTLRELDVPPYVLESPSDDPPELLGRTENGYVVLELWIADSGQVAKAGVLTSDLPEEFGQGALATFAATRFSPGRKDGAAVHSYIRMKVFFGPESIRDGGEKRHLPAQRLTPP